MYLLFQMVKNKNIHITNVVPSVVATKIGENAILADGTAHGKREKLIDEGMTAERCVEMYEHRCCMSFIFVFKQVCRADFNWLLQQIE